MRATLLLNQASSTRQREGGEPMSTSRVPGATRNSGWLAVTAKIVEARALGQQHREITATEAELQAEGVMRKPVEAGEVPRVAPDLGWSR